MENKAELAIIVPCYNEQEVLPKSIKILVALRENLIKKEEKEVAHDRRSRQK